MKKAIRNVVIGATCATMLFAMTGCVDDLEHLDTEVRPVALAIGAPDENFNPFFYTSGNDGEIIGMTQISLLTADADGNIVCGDDQATMALDYKITSWADANETTTATGDAADHTSYEFVIKNGVKDSNGNDMDIVDVLFNLYVYLDPMYSGSSTIYSTKIKGLAAYRSQIETDDETYDYEAAYRPDAEARFDAIIDYDGSDSVYSWGDVKDDVQKVAELFKKSLESDWTTTVGTVSSYSDEYRFTEDWEVYLWNEGLLNYQYEYVGTTKTRMKDENGKYYTTLDEPVAGATTDSDAANQAYFRTRIMEPAMAGLTGQEREEAMKKAAIDLVFNNYFIESDEDGIYEGNGSGKLTAILYSSISGDIMTAFIRDEMSKNSSGSDGELNVKSISGITVQRGVTSFDGLMGSDLKGEEYDVLKIQVDKVDPAAIYNFAFVVAPMDYYSGTYKGRDYAKYARENWYKSDNDEGASNRFGVCFQDSEFMDGIVGASSKTDVPVGAGPYKKHSSYDFYDGSMVHYERNTYFTTLGDSIDNAKIKYLNYVYTTDDMILSSLTQKTIDYGQPNCTQTNITQLTGISYLNLQNYLSNGFGYVGINPVYVPDREVRIAIMLALNPQNYIINNYYTTQYSEPIYRPTSSTNFLKNYDPNNYLKTPYTFQVDNPEVPGVIAGTKLEYTTNSRTITDLVESAGWSKAGSDVYTKNGKTLTLTFTVAGTTTDHPAWQMFTEAANQLNLLGFDITVKNDMTALQKLATGKLAVWAAAWTTGIDPDMYQIYHKDSNASSTKNWGYETIMNNSTLYPVENTIITHLSAEIDQARSYTQERYRAEHYINALNDVMELAVELPTYQRHDLGVYNNRVIKATSLNSKPSANAGLIFKIWELDYN